MGACGYVNNNDGKILVRVSSTIHCKPSWGYKPPCPTSYWLILTKSIIKWKETQLTVGPDTGRAAILIHRATQPRWLLNQPIEKEWVDCMAHQRQIMGETGYPQLSHLIGFVWPEMPTLVNMISTLFVVCHIKPRETMRNGKPPNIILFVGLAWPDRCTTQKKPNVRSNYILETLPKGSRGWFTAGFTTCSWSSNNNGMAPATILKKQRATHKKQDAAHEPECSHVEHFCETSYLNSLHVSPCRRGWSAKRVWSVECKV